MDSGITKMRKLMRETGLLPPLFESGYFFTATFRRHKKEKRGLAPTADPMDRAIRETIGETINEVHPVNACFLKYLFDNFHQLCKITNGYELFCVD